MRTATAILAAALPYSFDYYFVIDLFYNGDRVLANAPVTNVQLQDDASALVQRTGSCDLYYQDDFGVSLAPDAIGDILSPFGTIIDLDCVITIGPGFKERINIGSYLLSETPSIINHLYAFKGAVLSKGDIISLNFKDLMYGVQRDRFNAPGSPSQLTSVWDEIQLLMQLPVTKNVTLADTGIPNSVAYVDDKLQACYDLAATMGGILDMQSDGTVGMRPITWPSPVDTLFGGLKAASHVSTRTNLVPNPSTESGTTNISSAATGAGGTFSVAAVGFPGTTTYWTGLKASRCTWTAATTVTTAGTDLAVGLGVDTGLSALIPVTAGLAYTMSYYASSTVNQTIHGQIVWYNASSVALGSFVNGSDVTLTGGAGVFSRISVVNAVAPAGAAFMRIDADLGAGAIIMPISSVLNIDGVMVEQSATLNPYFDGDFLGAAWFGTRRDSKSTLTTAVVDTAYIPGTLVSVDKTMVNDNVYNAVIIQTTDPTGGTVVLSTAEVTSGPLRTQNDDGSLSPYRRVPYFYSSPFITLQGQADNYAPILLSQVSTLRSISVPLVEKFNPLRDLGDVITVSRFDAQGNQLDSFYGRVTNITRNSGSPTQTTTIAVGP